MSPAKAKTVKKKTPVARKRAPVRRKVYREKHIYLFFFGICFLQTAFLGTMLLFLVALKIPDVRSVAKYKPQQATIIYDRSGNIIDRMFTENRSVVPLLRMSPHLPKAFVAAEDGRFYEHPGLDLFSVVRAAINNIRSGAKSQGGSTITQQVAKSLLLTPEKTYIRKFKEAILAWRIDRLLSKDDILFIYLNQIYLGEGAHGVEAASQIYFGKNAEQLTLGECALLAGLPQAPSKYSLFDHLDRAVERQKYVLNRMAADGYISSTQAKRAYAEKIRLRTKSQSGSEESNYYLQVVKKRARKYLEQPLQSAGVRIYTYLDQEMQSQALDAVRRGAKASKARQNINGNSVGAKQQAALVCIETANSRVRAVVGGTSFKKSPFDRATQARRPAGSTFKPFVYTAALNKGFTARSIINDSPITFRGRDGKNWTPKNYSGKYHGQTSLTNAMAYSLNAATVRLMQKTGYKEVHRVARLAGIGSEMAPNLSLALGAVEVSLLEMTGSYIPFAGNGSYLPPTFIRKIIQKDGGIIYPEAGQKRQQVASKKVMDQMRVMLKGVIRYGTGKKVAEVKGVRGGKTGTSDDNRDAWFIGYNSRYTTGVWAGYDRNESMGKTESGGTTAAPIWRDFMLAVEKK